ncbi:WhiB family redox-sensing transcriptional regulator [Arcanobacterium wilhelmae]|uniref:Transcriptional regulator WhiB n=1 Tax=Arcanobacterium wilhelmae TaxID=1803177 RepID=A0ABT9N9L5_9ACTO|nr:WhiB family transcriptional regulator [Arcanobacterium wilhelmae]MDP9800405.1 WhiB family redox-sensing transcriptional regulator [Arcanobacterium wilhelmae]WFN89834.1 WhiB family transcriptional regulator [Arcanobacterium wilhelmae]
MDWRNKAACLHEDPELFFPVGSSGPAMAQMERAKLVCQNCPVAQTCLKVALETNQDCGVWGGKSEDERKALKRKAARSARVASMA